ncbi:MAG TPA: hypothetical protein DEP35_11845 [Deltaproteobacteria bacterium]|nr:hypothetical protein [Deltaproteobacteria bacterium]
MIEVLRDFPGNVIAVVCSGRVTRLEYDTVLVPVVTAALKAHPKLRLYYETGSGFSIEPSAIWEDFRLGVEHLTRWARIAVVTDVEWVRHTVRAFSFLMPGEVRTFTTSEAARARAWIGEELAPAES